jgi:hypothetical protein
VILEDGTQRDELVADLHSRWWRVMPGSRMGLYALGCTCTYPEARTETCRLDAAAARAAGACMVACIVHEAIVDNAKAGLVAPHSRRCVRATSSRVHDPEAAISKPERVTAQPSIFHAAGPPCTVMGLDETGCEIAPGGGT